MAVYPSMYIILKLCYVMCNKVYGCMSTCMYIISRWCHRMCIEVYGCIPKYVHYTQKMPSNMW